MLSDFTDDDFEEPDTEERSDKPKEKNQWKCMILNQMWLQKHIYYLTLLFKENINKEALK